MASWQAWKKRLGSTLLVAALSALSAVSTPAFAADPVLSISTTAATPAAVNVDVLISGVSDLFAFQYTLSFDPTVLQASFVTEGSLLASGGTTFFDGGSIDNALGTISFTFNTLIGDVAGVSGSGSLAHIGFNVAQAGSSALSFSDVLFLDSAFADITLQVANGVVQAVPEPATLALFGLGLAGIAAARRRRAA